jgi:hypothetical protein
MSLAHHPPLRVLSCFNICNSIGTFVSTPMIVVASNAPICTQSLVRDIFENTQTYESSDGFASRVAVCDDLPYRCRRLHSRTRINVCVSSVTCRTMCASPWRAASRKTRQSHCQLECPHRHCHQDHMSCITLNAYSSIQTVTARCAIRDHISRVPNERQVSRQRAQLNTTAYIVMLACASYIAQHAHIARTQSAVGIASLQH